MNDQVKITVITPAFNRAEIIDKTLRSVLEQNFTDFEYLIVDDGSTDETLRVLQDQDDHRVVVLTHEKNINKGQAASINLALKRARGQYIVILDSDDLLAPGTLEHHSKLLDLNGDLGMVYGQGYMMDNIGTIGGPIFPAKHVESSDPGRLLLDCYIVSPGLCMFRKSVVDEVGFLEEQFRAAQDHDFVLRVAERSTIAYSGIDCFFYRKHDNTISSQGQMTRWTNGFEILRRAAQRYPYARKIIRKRKAVLYFRLGQSLWRNSKRIAALRCFLVAGSLDPARSFRVILGAETAAW